MLLLWFYPTLVASFYLFVTASRRKAPLTDLTSMRHVLAILGLLAPWLMMMIYRSVDLWLMTAYGSVGMMLLIFRSRIFSREAWVKAAVSQFLGLMFLTVSVLPALGLPFPVSTEVAQLITATALIAGVFLLFGLPPLQLGVVDIGTDKSTAAQIYLSLGLRFSMAFLLLLVMSYSHWTHGIEPFHGFVASTILMGIGLTRLVLRLQSSPFRMLSYLISGLAFAVVVKILFPEQGEVVLVILTLAYLQFYVLMNRDPGGLAGGDDLRDWTAFQIHHEHLSSRFQRWLKAYLYLESAACTVLAVFCTLRGHWFVGLVALLAGLCSLAVNRDKYAFTARVRAAI